MLHAIVFVTAKGNLSRALTTGSQSKAQRRADFQRTIRRPTPRARHESGQIQISVCSRQPSAAAAFAGPPSHSLSAATRKLMQTHAALQSRSYLETICCSDGRER
ncbi:hypothetical protein MRX96_013981 [Rhipicephalus microplus]